MQDTTTQSPSSYSTRDVEVGFPRQDVLVAKVVVARLIKNGWRKGPSQLLLLSDSAYDSWLNEEAIAWLREQKQLRQGAPLEL
jgi:hypothetical protein